MMGLLSSIKENRQSSTLSNPKQWLVDFLTGGNQSSTGLTITEENAMTYTAVYAAVKILAESVASLPLHLYRRLKRGKEKAITHRLYTLLHDQPNPEMTSFNWREAKMGHLCLYGNAYSEIEWGNDGHPKALWPLNPSKTWPERDKKTGYIVYNTILPDGRGVKLPAERVFHIPGMGFNGLVGFSPIRLFREAIGLGLATEKFGASFFGNDSRPGGVLKHPGQLSEDAHDRIQRDWERMHKGLDKFHRVAILEEGLEWQQIGIPPEDAQFLQTRKFQVTEIARIYRVPPHMIADLERATFSNIEHQGIEFVIHTLRPYLVRWEQAIKKDLIVNKRLFAKFNVEGLLRGDSQARGEYYNRMFQIGAYSINDILELEDKNPIGPEGDHRFVPLNMIPLDASNPKLENNRSLEIKKKEDRAVRTRQVRSAQARRRLALAYRKIIRKSAEKLVNKETEIVREEARKQLNSRDEYDFNLWLEEFYREFPETAKEEMKPVISALAEAIAEEAGKEVNLDEIEGLDNFVKSYVESFSIRYSKYSRNQLQALVREAIEKGQDPLELIEQRLDEWEEKRPDKVAQEESIKGAGAFSKFVFAAGGVTKLVWVTMGSDPCPYCLEMDGTVVGIEENFLGAGDSLGPDDGDGPLQVSGNIGHPPLHQGCECGISPA